MALRGRDCTVQSKLNFPEKKQGQGFVGFFFVLIFSWVWWEKKKRGGENKRKQQKYKSKKKLKEIR